MRRREGPSFAVIAASVALAGPGCAALSGLDALEVCQGAACDAADGGRDVAAPPDTGSSADAADDQGAPGDASTEPETSGGRDGSARDASPDASDVTFRCGENRCTGADVCCLGVEPDCHAQCTGSQKTEQCIDVATCAPRGGGVCCVTAGQGTSCQPSCAGTTACVATSDCPSGQTCTGTDTSLGITIRVCQ